LNSNWRTEEFVAKRTRGRKPETYYQEIVRRYISKRHGCVAVRELDFGGPKFDVVGFSPDSDEFHIVECKRTARPVGVGQTFGQILAYKAMIHDAGERFLDSFNKKLIEDGITEVRFWAHAFRFAEAGKIPVRFYVALLNKACERPEILQLIKNDLKEVGIIRIDQYNHCKDYVRKFGEKDHEICRAAPVQVPISRPIRNDIKVVLDNKKSNRDLSLLIARLDERILRMRRKRIKCVKLGKYGLVYRVRRNFVALYPRKNHLRLHIREKKGWRKHNVKQASQVRRVFIQIRQAMERSGG
jgi:hypothetical protein